MPQRNAMSYRIIDHGKFLALHAINVTEDNPEGWTDDPVSFVADAEDGPGDIIEALEKALWDARYKPIMKLVGGKPVEK